MFAKLEDYGADGRARRRVGGDSAGGAATGGGPVFDGEAGHDGHDDIHQAGV